jgi:hypothetical protein
MMEKLPYYTSRSLPSYSPEFQGKSTYHFPSYLAI